MEKGKDDFPLLLMCLAQALIGPLVAAGGIAWLCHWAGLDGRPVSFWILIAPLVYLAWLFLLLVCYNIETGILGLFYQKPARYHSRQKDGAMAFKITTLLYGHCFLLGSLPFILLMLHSRFLAGFIFRAYSTKVFIEPGAWLANLVVDPDLTFIGTDVVIGEGCHIVAHSAIRTADGAVLFQSAPVRLEAGCTLGGGSQIEMGVTIGAGSLVEPRSHVLPFTKIPPGEVWGGNPAVFRRKRAAVPENVGHEAVAPTATIARTTADDKTLYVMVAEALGVSAERITAETSAQNCLEWDSIGRMAIGAALHDRFGLDLRSEIINELDSIVAVKKVVSGRWEPRNGAATFTLPKNPELLPLLDPVPVLAALAEQTPDKAAASLKKVRVVIAATFVATPLASALKLYARAFGLEAEVAFFDFNQVPQALLGPESLMRKNCAGLNVVLVRPEDLPGKNRDERRMVATQLLDAIRNFAATAGGALLVNDLPPTVTSDGQERRVEIAELQSWWAAELASVSGVEALGFAEIIEELGRVAARATGSDDDATVPYSPVVYQRLGIGIVRTLRKLNRPAKKVLALDADNTLWGGVVGEDGDEGIQLDDAAGGRGFRELQSKILALKQRGILLVLVSKNSAEDVWNVVENHPRMILRRKDFAAARINWDPKSENLRALAAELNLGADSFVLLDDNPAERLEVAANCPEVTVVPLTARPEESAGMLSRLWCFDGAGETSEDGKRHEYGQQEIRRKEFEESTGLEEYLKELELKVVMRTAAESDLARVAQLLQKTNQFNLSLKRRSLPETRQLLPGHDIWVVSVTDRFGDYGTVGVCIARRENETLFLDSLLMSCRALGRGAEAAFLHGIAEKARLAGARTLRGEFVAGPRNQPMEQFLKKSGFVNGPGAIYELTLEVAPGVPKHLTLHIAQ